MDVRYRLQRDRESREGAGERERRVLERVKEVGFFYLEKEK